MGRAAERAALAEILARHRLVTAVGPGGVGKTRLALVVATELTDQYADGAWYVDLVPVTDDAMVGATVANAFGFGEQPGRSPTDTVIAKLAAAEALVVLDNCEHVLDGVTAFVERLLTGCPRTAVLATSRARLRLPFEYAYPVPGLSLDDTGEGESDAVALFVERAGMAGWSSPYPHDRPRIAAICSGLEGVALAIELAAARLATFGIDGLEAGLADQLGLLAGGPRLDARHRSVRSALDWSFGLLTEEDQVGAAAGVGVRGTVHSRRGGVGRGLPAAGSRGRAGGPGPPRRQQPADAVCPVRPGPATGCWRPSGSTATSGWSKRTRSPTCAAAT